MQSSLKKSLYLGLAALSFASVASVTANSSNANAAKKHAAAKKVTYKTTNKDLDQTVTFKSTGKNAVYNKPVGKRSVKASLTDMKSKANSNSTKDLFMAYQEGVTSKGVHYYKVVSFDKKVRGFVYNKGVAKTNTTVAADKPSNAGYLTNTSRFFNKPYGSQFKTTLKNDYKNMNIAADQFTVADAVKVNNDQTYYYVKDTKNELVNGWVNSIYFSNKITPAAQKATDSENAVHVNFVDDANLGSVAFSANVNPSNIDNNGNYTGQNVNSAIGNAVKTSGYSLDGDNGYPSINGNAMNNNTNVAKGSTVTVRVHKSADANLTYANLKPAVISQNGLNVNYNTNGSDVDNINGALKSTTLPKDTFNNLFKGNSNAKFDINNFESNLFATGKPMNTFTPDNGKTVYVYNSAATKSHTANPNLFDSNNQPNANLTYGDVASNGLTVVYDKKVNNQSMTGSDNGNVNGYGFDAKAYNDYVNGMKSDQQSKALPILKGARSLGFYLNNKSDSSSYNALKDAFVNSEGNHDTNGGSNKVDNLNNALNKFSMDNNGNIAFNGTTINNNNFMSNKPAKNADNLGNAESYLYSLAGSYNGLKGLDNGVLLK